MSSFTYSILTGRIYSDRLVSRAPNDGQDISRPVHLPHLPGLMSGTHCVAIALASPGEKPPAEQALKDELAALGVSLLKNTPSMVAETSANGLSLLIIPVDGNHKARLRGLPARLTVTRQEQPQFA